MSFGSIMVNQKPKYVWTDNGMLILFKIVLKISQIEKTKTYKRFFMIFILKFK